MRHTFLSLAIAACGFPVLLPGASGLALSADGATAYDAANNVTWLADFNLAASNRFGLPVCSSGSKPCVNASGSMTYQAAAAWVSAMNAANYLGHNNWQLPTTPIVDKSCGRTGPSGASFGFGCIAGALAAIYNALGFKSPNTTVPIPANTAGPFSQPSAVHVLVGIGRLQPQSGSRHIFVRHRLAGRKYAAQFPVPAADDPWQNPRDADRDK